MSRNGHRHIRVDALARVEGEGALDVVVEGGRLADVKLRIYEPPRFFEAFLRGRRLEEAPDITARICGICPVAYQMSSVHAMEAALGVGPTPAIRALRRLLYCGEWIESHALHVYFLHAPDFLGYESAIHMARDHAAVVERALFLKKTGNEIVTVVGGREIHPVNVRVGGFYRGPSARELAPLREKLLRARDIAQETVRFTAGLSFPDLERDYELVALVHPSEYPLNEGRIVSTKGLDVGAKDFEDHIEEKHVPYSNALHASLRGRGAYKVGPLARFALNFDKLSPIARDAARAAGVGPDCRNPFKSIVVRAVETLWACDEAVRIIDSYEPPDPPAIAYAPREGIGHACTEAPRGILFHRYRVGADGLIADARIVPPTAQNQRTIEDDLRDFVPRNLSLDDRELTLRCEQAVRNYDPCISCATHHLKVRIERR